MILGITGFKGVGKDTAADYLVAAHHYNKIAFADKLKEAVAALLNIDIDTINELKEVQTSWGGTKGEVSLRIYERDDGEPNEYNFTWREFLQRFGTEMGRNVFGHDFWVKLAFDKMAYTTDDWVISDVRFANEAEAIHRADGKILQIFRPGFESDGHESEIPMPGDLIDYGLANQGTIGDMHKDLDEIIEDILGG